MPLTSRIVQHCRSLQGKEVGAGPVPRSGPGSLPGLWGSARRRADRPHASGGRSLRCGRPPRPPALRSAAPSAARRVCVFAPPAPPGDPPAAPGGLGLVLPRPPHGPEAPRSPRLPRHPFPPTSPSPQKSTLEAPPFPSNTNTSNPRAPPLPPAWGPCPTLLSHPGDPGPAPSRASRCYPSSGERLGSAPEHPPRIPPASTEDAHERRGKPKTEPPAPRAVHPSCEAAA